MQQQQSKPTEQTDVWLTELVARSLEISVSQLDIDTHLSSYGLDSVSTIAILMEISDITGLEINETALLDYPTISLLALHISARTGATRDIASPADARTNLYDLMRKDSILPDDIQPAAGEMAANPAAILLTGATGFLGIHLLDTLTRNTRTHIYCLIRSSDGLTPFERLAGAISENRLELRDWEDRVTVVEGDICEPYLGLATNTFEHLASSIDSVYHCAADVNWGLDYASLRNSNVLPVVDLLRLCGLRKKKNFVFVSSISVCYAYQGPDTVAENISALSLIKDIHLGYAQSKVIAEALCEQAIARGLAVTIHRPALILGNSNNGLSNNDDLVSRVIKGCISMGCAPDLDWLVDACPVNDVADAIYSLSAMNDASLGITHLVHPKPRYWRELVLWINIYGYPVKLVPYSQWTDQLAKEAISAGHPLYPLRAFFLHRLAEADELALPEIYEEHRHSKVVATNTLSALTAESVQFTSLDSDLFERYFEVFRESRFLPVTSNSRTDKSSRDIHTVLNNRFFTDLAEEVFNSPESRNITTKQLKISTDDSIITDLASWKFGKPSGLFRYRLQDDSAHECEVFIKVKPEDRAVLDVAAIVADLCVEGLGALFYKFKRQTGLAGCHNRELAIYRQSDPRFLRHSPRTFLLVDDAEQQKWIIAMETISESIFMDTSVKAHRWSPEHIINCIDGLAEFHSIWLGREGELVNQDQLCNLLTASDMEEAKPLWFSIARHADGFFKSTIGETLGDIRNEIVDSVHKWWGDIESLDRTLIHNDFNPRNIAILRRQGQPALCAFDWELAAIGLPQRDLAEFLCFALPPDLDKSETGRYIEHHRKMLERASGLTLDKGAWMYGFQLALFDMAINRIPMYTLIHRIKPQEFLPRVTRTWFVLFKEYCNTMRL